MSNRIPSTQSSTPTMEAKTNRDFSDTDNSGPIIETDDYFSYYAYVNDDEYFGSFPPGYRFRPLDEELIVDYLKKKVDEEELPRNRINEVKLYKDDPDTLAAMYDSSAEEWNGEREWYFFTPRDRKYPNGTRPNRSAGDGYWKATGKGKPVHFNGKEVGLKTTLVYYRGEQQKGDKTNWIMYEYTVIDAPEREKTSQNDMTLDDWVLCKIKKKNDTAKSVSSTQIQPTEIQNMEISDDTAKSVSSTQIQAAELHHEPENVSSIPVTSGGNHSGEDFDFIPFYNKGISESTELFSYAPAINAQPLMSVPSKFDDNDIKPWMASLESNSFDDTMEMPNGNINHEPLHKTKNL